MELETFLAAAVDLLAVPSTADRPAELKRALDVVVDFVGPGFVVEWFEANGVPSALLYAGRHGDGPRPSFRLILNAHLDVVPAEPAQFRPQRDGGRLYARGAQDMKVSGLVQALVFRELAAVVDYPLALQLVTDEEVTGRDGTLHQLESGVTGEFVVIGERSRLDIVTDTKGMLQVTARASGRGAHGAYPWLGDNALVKLVTTVMRLVERYPAAAEEIWRTTVNVARIDTPNRAFNQIPDRAEAWLDVRFPAEDADLTGGGVAGALAYLQTFAEPGVVFELDQYDSPQHTDRDRPEIAALGRAARAQGYAGDLVRQHGGSDAGFYSAHGIPAVAFGIGGGGQHGPEEYADLATIEPYYRALTDFVRRL